jgi:hypothetical protein
VLYSKAFVKIKNVRTVRYWKKLVLLKFYCIALMCMESKEEKNDTVNLYVFVNKQTNKQTNKQKKQTNKKTNKQTNSMF